METRRLRQKIEKEKKGQQIDRLAYVSDEFNKTSEKLSLNGEDIENGRLLVKSSSENLLTVPKNFSKNGTKNEKIEIYNNRRSVAGRYKLDLKSLAILDPNRMV